MVRKIKKIQLINPPLSTNYLTSSKAGAYPPLNLSTLSTYFKKKNRDIVIDILDGEIISIEQIIFKLDADLVGITAGILNYEEAIKIAKAAKQIGAEVIMGGPYPTAIPQLILKNRPYIDAVVIGDGEESLYLYALNEDKRAIPNLAYRENGNIKYTNQVDTPMDSIDFANYDVNDLFIYYNNFREKYSFKPFRGSLAVFSSKGCSWRDISGGCIYCAVQTKRFIAKQPNIYWNEIELLSNKYDVNYFWDVTDTFTRPINRLKELVSIKPANLAAKFLLYGRSDDINDLSASLLSQFGAYEIFLGVESGDNKVLKNARRGQIASKAIKAVNILNKYKIKAIVSFQVGLPGDNDRSCEASLKLAKELAETGNVSEVFSSMLLPMPGSNAFSMLMECPGMKNKYDGLDILPLEELRRDFIDNFCMVDYDRLANVRDDIMKIFPLSSSLGKPKGGS